MSVLTVDDQARVDERGQRVAASDGPGPRTTFDDGQTSSGTRSSRSRATSSGSSRNGCRARSARPGRRPAPPGRCPHRRSRRRGAPGAHPPRRPAPPPPGTARSAQASSPATPNRRPHRMIRRQPHRLLRPRHRPPAGVVDQHPRLDARLTRPRPQPGQHPASTAGRGPRAAPRARPPSRSPPRTAPRPRPSPRRTRTRSARSPPPSAGTPGPRRCSPRTRRTREHRRRRCTAERDQRRRPDRALEVDVQVRLGQRDQVPAHSELGRSAVTCRGP
jgi:hypothetical protein